jgi:hypothetical protein
MLHEKAVGRAAHEQVAITIVSAQDPENVRTTPCGHFCGMVASAKADEHNLDRTPWATRRAAQPEFR